MAGTDSTEGEGPFDLEPAGKPALEPAGAAPGALAQDPQPAAAPAGRPGRHYSAGNSSVRLQTVQPGGLAASMAGVAAPAGGSLARKRQVMDHFLLALRSSELARVVDPGTLHYWLDSTFQEHTRSGALQLQGVFSTLIAEPGVEARMVAPPLLALKSWEAKVGIRVSLPAELEALTEVERKQHLVRFPVQAGDVERLLGRAAVGLKPAPRPVEAEPVVARGPKLSAAYADPAAAARAALQHEAQPKKKKRAAGQMSKGRRAFILVAGSLAPVALAISLYLTFRPIPIHEIDPSVFASTGVQVLQARHKLTVVVLTVGPGFAQLPREAQVAASERVLRVASEHGATGIHLVDTQGRFLLSKTDMLRNHQ